MRYCSRCLMPDTRPGIILDRQGVCNACRQHEAKEEVDWRAREREFARLADWAREQGRGHDCLVPVSGGKDSFWQVLTCLEYGLNPLAVTCRPTLRTPLGQANLERLVALGVDHIDYRIDPGVERRFIYLTLARAGSPSIPFHLAMHSVPGSLALALGIPLVVWGENSALEYGSVGGGLTGPELTRRWFEHYGATQGTRAQDWLGEGLDQRDLAPYLGPDQDQLAAAGVKGIFLGYYFAWDPRRSLELALSHGFQPDSRGPRTGHYDFADLDDPFIAVHHYLKWYKFGMTRAFDTLSLEIRRGRITREQALEILRRQGEQRPRVEIQQMCSFLEMDQDHFWELAERFRNRDIWQRREGRWEIPGFIVPDWEWT